MHILARTYPLASGPRVRLRLAVRSDAPAVAELLRGRGLDAGPTAVRRLLSYDPRRRAVICAFAPVDGCERLVGIAAGDLRDGADPDTLVVDERLTDGLAGLLTSVLAEKSAYRERRVA